MKYVKQKLLQDLNNQRAIREHYSPGTKEHHTMNGQEQYKDAADKIKQLEKALKLLEAGGQTSIF